MSQKTIIYTGGFELPDKNAAAQRVVANAKLLREIGYEVVFIGIDKEAARLSKNYFWDFESYAVEYPVSIFSWLRFICSISEVARISKEKKADAIIAYNYPAIALGRLLIWGHRHGIKVISDCTEWYHPQGNIFRRVIKTADVWLRMRIIHPRLDGLIAISRYLYDWYSSRMGNVVILPPLVDKKDKKWEHAPEGKNVEKPLSFVYAGSTGKEKDRLDWVLCALSEVYKNTQIPFEFHILGLTRKEYETNFLIPKEISLFIHFLGRVPHAEVIKKLTVADYQIFFRERTRVNMAGFPTKFVETISGGAAAIVNDFSDVGKFLKEGKNGVLVDISDKKELTKQIGNIFQKGSLGKPFVEVDLFDYRKYRERIELFLKKINLDDCCSNPVKHFPLQ